LYQCGEFFFKIACSKALICLFAIPAFAEPAAILPVYNHVGEQLMASGGRTREDVAAEIPTRQEIGLPVYPDLFYSGSITAEGMMPSLVLASGDPVETVRAWYESQPELQYDEQSKVFYTGESYAMHESESIFLQDISDNPKASVGGMVFDMHGMKTQITISYKPKTGANDE
jgi:hypothetical protein